MKNRKSGRRLLILLVVLTLLIGAAAGGTVAWLMTSTEPLVNTFVSGDINITLNETFPTDDTIKIGETDYNAKKLLPGDSTTKEPRVTVEKGSEKCYVRMFTVVWWPDEADSQFNGDQSADWFTGSEINQSVKVNEYIDRVSNNVLSMVFEVIFNDAVDASTAAVTLPAPYTTINIPADLKQAQYESLEGVQVIVIAQAVQAEGFASAEAAFAETGYPQADIPTRETTQKLETIIANLKNQNSGS